MAKVADGVIYLRKGDTESLSVSAKNGETAYSFLADDVLTFTIRELPEQASEVLLTQSVTVSAPAQTVEITLPASLTRQLSAGKYSCDVQLNSGGTIKTLFPITNTESPRYKATNWKNCIVEGEVTVND